MPFQFDNSLHISQHEKQNGVVWVHMDNGVVIQSNENIIMQLVFNLKDFLEIEWQQGVETFLGVELINKILDDYWEKASLTKSPAPSGYHALTENQIEDILTKALTPEKHDSLAKIIQDKTNP
ncbi:uncharacterized protein VP01_3642g1 [Puccinia sorghi]|uniref:Uncharacterized protein n=1 Tax=Puccinia sorghi TaxID=27349 RepID=A0A0L6UVD7_9BASI|nr:uncharacterized protein VP01_3642g1 [Puccinia sorghi]